MRYGAHKIGAGDIPAPERREAMFSTGEKTGVWIDGHGYTEDVLFIKREALPKGVRPCGYNNRISFYEKDGKVYAVDHRKED